MFFGLTLYTRSGGQEIMWAVQAILDTRSVFN